FRGGRAVANYLVLTGNAHGQLGVDEGYVGTVEYMVGVQGGGDSSDNGDNGIKVSDESYLELSNFTLLAADSTQGSGIRVNTGANPWFYNGVVVHGNTCLDYEQTAGDGRPGYLLGSDPLFNSVLFDCPDLVTTDTDNGDDPDTGRAAVETPGGNNVVASNTLDGFIAGALERGVSGAFSNHIGAFNPEEETNADNWAAGWTRDLLPEPVCPEGTEDAGYDTDGGEDVCYRQQ
ncbi:MAG: hypothetical protein GDA35_08610, partial [Hyphomonadaceae bacterium]|nr:hypothetical protein [Hyphomonadaceae bacterium]